MEQGLTVLQATGGGYIGQEVMVMGWVRTKREGKNISFISLNDGTALRNLQVVAEADIVGEGLLKQISFGYSLRVWGKVVASQGKGQAVELTANRIEVLGEADAETYPIQPKRHSLEFLREIAHLRVRTQTFSAIYRVRNAMIFAVHSFFQERGYVNVHTPILTASDAEGAGKMFQVTTLPLDEELPRCNGKVDYSQDFFGQAVSLTVSGQLEGELSALALRKIYTFGPTFRAENSNTPRHLAEFWMIEPEVAFFDKENNMDLAKEMLKYLICWAIEKCREDIAFLAHRLEEEEKNKPQAERSMNLLEKLDFVVKNPFESITYTEAIEVLKKSKTYKKGKFKFPVEWGEDLQVEHERYLVEKHYGRPVIVTDYPKGIKAFYMKLNDDERTVQGMDVLFPQIGEIIGGSVREERLDILEKRMKECGVEPETMNWYLDTRKFGTAPHAGFGLGFERLMLFITGMSNIRDVIPFPRTPSHCKF